MKRFIFSILMVTVFFLGVGALIDTSSAHFKSDEKALELVRKARTALGGESSLVAVQSMIIKGRTTHTVNLNGSTRTEQGDSEIAFQMPDKVMHMVKIGDANGADDDGLVDKQVDVVVVRNSNDGEKVAWTGKDKGAGTTSSEPKTKVFVKHGEGDKAPSTWTTKDGNTINVEGKDVIIERAGAAKGHHTMSRHNEMLRLTLSLLLTAPQGVEVDYTYGGEGNVDGTSCDIVLATAFGQSFKLYLDRSSNLPVMMSYNSVRIPRMMHFEKEAAPGADGKERVVFQKIDASKAPTAEFTVKFSDYRSTGGVQLPYKWTQTVGGEADEVFDVTSYEINPANILERFKDVKVKVRKPETN